METHGVFGGNSSRAGRVKWRLERESLGRELDCSCSRLVCAKHKTVGKTPNADKETWDMLEAP